MTVIVDAARAGVEPNEALNKAVKVANAKRDRGGSCKLARSDAVVGRVDPLSRGDKEGAVGNEKTQTEHGHGRGIVTLHHNLATVAHSQ